MSVSAVMTSEVPIVAPGDSLLDAARRMTDSDVKAMAVCDGERVVGIITDWDITRAVAAAAPSPSVADYMTGDVVSVGVDTPLGEAGSLMADRRIHHLVVRDGERYAGMLHLDVEWADLGGVGEHPHATFAAAV